MGSEHSIQAVLSDCIEIIRPPRRVSVSQAAKESVRVNVPGGYHGPWDPAITPEMVEPMDLLASREYEAVVLIGPAQSGKTQALVDGMVAYIVTCDPSDAMIVQTSQETARDFSRRRIDRLHRHSPSIRAHLSPRRNDDNTHDKCYRAGNILTIGWPSINQLSGRTIRFMLLTDYDRMPLDIDGEGAPFDLALKRTQTFMSRGMTMLESSPGWNVQKGNWVPSTLHEAPPTLGISAIYNSGDRRKRYWCCLNCGEPFAVPGLPNWNTEEKDIAKAAETAYIPCPTCGFPHTQRHKNELRLGGEWLSERSGTKIASYWLTGPSAAFQTWPSLVQKYLQAKAIHDATGSEEALKTTTNLDQGMFYTPRAMKAERTPDALSQRAQDEEWDRGTVPNGVRFLVATVDVQANRFVLQVIGFGIGLESWLIDRVDLTQAPGDPSISLDPAARFEDWGALAPWLEKTYPMLGAPENRLPIRAMFCDSGGRAGVTERAYGYWRAQRRAGRACRFNSYGYITSSGFGLIKGERKPTAPRWTVTYPDNSARSSRKANARGEIPVLMAHVNTIKDGLDKDLKRLTPGPGYVHFPAWTPPHVFDEMTVETRGPSGWLNPGGRNESWDLFVYARAVAYALGAEKWGEKWEKAPKWADPERQDNQSETRSSPKEPKQHKIILGGRRGLLG